MTEMLMAFVFVLICTFAFCLCVGACKLGYSCGKRRGALGSNANDHARQNIRPSQNLHRNINMVLSQRFIPAPFVTEANLNPDRQRMTLAQSSSSASAQPNASRNQNAQSNSSVVWCEGYNGPLFRAGLHILSNGSHSPQTLDPHDNEYKMPEPPPSYEEAMRNVNQPTGLL